MNEKTYQQKISTIAMWELIYFNSFLFSSFMLPMKTMIFLTEFPEILGVLCILESNVKAWYYIISDRPDISHRVMFKLNWEEFCLIKCLS